MTLRLSHADLFSRILLPHPSTLFPYTTLFRSAHAGGDVDSVDLDAQHVEDVRARETLRASATERAEGFTGSDIFDRSEEHTSELQSLRHLVCRLLLEKKKIITEPIVCCLLFYV